MYCNKYIGYKLGSVISTIFLDSSVGSSSQHSAYDVQNCINQTKNLYNDK